MPMFPMFVSLKGKKCVVVGGGAVAARKVGILIEFEADVLLVSPDIDPSLYELYIKGKIKMLKREYKSDDIAGAFLSVAATSDRALNEKIYTDSVERNIFVNVADSPEKCTFVFPSVVKREELVIGISTSGIFPAMSAKVRRQIDDVIPESYGKILKLLGEARKKVQEEILVQWKRKQVVNAIQEFIVKNFGLHTEEEMLMKVSKIIGEYKNETGY